MTKLVFVVAVVLSAATAACARPRAPGLGTAATASGAPPAPARARTLPQPGVHGVAFGAGGVYAWMGGGRLDKWNGVDGPASPVGLAGTVVALAGDGSLAVTATIEAAPRTRLDVWALDTRTRTATRSFEDGIDGVLAVTRAVVALHVNFPRAPETHVNAVLPERSFGAFWNLERNTVAQQPGLGRCEGGFAMTADALRFACDGLWRDTRRNRTVLANVAPDWRPPPPPVPPEPQMPRKPVMPPPYHHILSVGLDADGSNVYLTYRGVDQEGWRLERWTPGTVLRSGPVTREAPTRLASTGGGRARLLAVSGDGRLLVLGGDGERLTLRRAPGYEPQTLTPEGATAAALSPDGERLVTGHVDGHLRLWEAPSGRLLATASP